MPFPIMLAMLGAAALKNKRDEENENRDKEVNAVKEANSTYRDANEVPIRYANPWGNLAQFGMAGLQMGQEDEAYKGDQALKKAQTKFYNTKATDPGYQSGSPWGNVGIHYQANYAPSNWGGFTPEGQTYKPKTGWVGE